MGARYRVIILGIIVVALHRHCQSSRVQFTNVICNFTDPSYVRVNKCSLKAESRFVQYFTGSITVLDLPITDFTLRIQFLKRLNGWKPFLYDYTLRCNFTRQINQLQRIVWRVVRNVSNIQHDCPFNQTFDLPRADNIYINEILKIFPIPPGKYGVMATLQTHNITRGFLNWQVSIE